ncbi:MAG: hypothetical protein AAF664_19675 [Planctomycetota bacterium]
MFKLRDFVLTAIMTTAVFASSGTTKAYGPYGYKSFGSYGRYGSVGGFGSARAGFYGSRSTSSANARYGFYRNNFSGVNRGGFGKYYSPYYGSKATSLKALKYGKY